MAPSFVNSTTTLETVIWKRRYCDICQVIAKMSSVLVIVIITLRDKNIFIYAFFSYLNLHLNRFIWYGIRKIHRLWMLWLLVSAIHCRFRAQSSLKPSWQISSSLQVPYQIIELVFTITVTILQWGCRFVTFSYEQFSLESDEQF